MTEITVECLCGWSKTKTEENSFSQNVAKSATQAAKGHASTTGCDYEDIKIND